MKNSSYSNNKNMRGDEVPAEEFENEAYPRVIRELGDIALILNNLDHKLKNELAIEHWRHGLGRRVFTLKGSLKRILEISPPTRKKILDEKEKSDLTAHLHCFFINHSGAYNNLAWIWYYEKLSEDEQKGLNLSEINLFNKKFKKYLPDKLMVKCNDYSDWHNNLNDFRHPLAHRIPFYVVPYTIKPSDKEKYDALNTRWSQSRDPFEMENLMDEMDSLGEHTGFISGSFRDGKMITLHQVVPDAMTLIEVVKIFYELI